jgi:hypothetical protein
MRVERGIS